ncbi:MAG: NfeD family protein [Lachnospiraceae bacterium]|nr:NfeD family protein [Lachnospiraceae bacterium]
MLINIEEATNTGGLSRFAILIIIWLAVLVISLIAELMTQGLTTIWMCGGALVALIVTICHGPVWLQATLFVIVTVALLIVTRPIAQKHYNNRLIKTNAENLIGQQALVIETVSNIGEKGAVKLAGLEWTARTVDGSVIEAGENVVVESIEGVKLIVKKL